MQVVSYVVRMAHKSCLMRLNRMGYEFIISVVLGSVNTRLNRSGVRNRAFVLRMCFSILDLATLFMQQYSFRPVQERHLL